MASRTRYFTKLHASAKVGQQVEVGENKLGHIKNSR